MKFTIETKFNVGDRVKVIDNGFCYSTYPKFAAFHGLNRHTKKRLNNGEIGKIAIIGLHHENNNVLCGVQREDTTQFIISVEGLSLMSETEDKIDKIIELVEELRSTIKR